MELYVTTIKKQVKPRQQFFTSVLERPGAIPVSLGTQTATSLYNVEFSSVIVNKYLIKFQSNFQHGNDNLSAMFLKKFLLFGLYLHSLLCHHPLNLTHCLIWTIDSLTSIFKKGDKFNPFKYPPIT